MTSSTGRPFYRTPRVNLTGEGVAVSERHSYRELAATPTCASTHVVANRNTAGAIQAQQYNFWQEGLKPQANGSVHQPSAAK